MNEKRTALIRTGGCLGFGPKMPKKDTDLVDWDYTIWTEEGVRLDKIRKHKQKVWNRKEKQEVISLQFKVPYGLMNEVQKNRAEEVKLIKATKPMIQSNKFPHEFDELKGSLNHTIEDNLKISAELASDKTPGEKWSLYQQFCSWVSVCERLGIEISNKDEVFVIMNGLWRDVRKSDLYKPKK